MKTPNQSAVKQGAYPVEFHPKSGVNADRGPEQPSRNPAEDMQLSAAVHLCALVAMVILFAAMLTFRGC